MKNQKGFSLIELLVVVIIIAIIAAIAIPSLLASRRAANHSSAVANLRTVVSAQATHASLNSGQYETTFAQLGTDGFVDGSWTGTPTKNGYVFTLTAPDGDGYCVDAVANANQGDFDYAVSHEGVIYQDGADTAVSDCDPANGDITGTVLGS